MRRTAGRPGPVVKTTREGERHVHDATAQTTQVYQVFIKATAEAIWEAITKPEFTERYFYGARIENTLERHRALGPDGSVWGDEPIYEFDPPRRLVQGWRSLDHPVLADEPESRVSWEIGPQEGGYCLLTVTHDRLEDAPGDGRERRRHRLDDGAERAQDPARDREAARRLRTTGPAATGGTRLPVAAHQRKRKEQTREPLPLQAIPPRPTFDQDMSENEGAIMARHVAYWQELAERGTAIVFGPVSDPAGAWGLAVVEAETKDQVRALGDLDPAVTSGLATLRDLPDARRDHRKCPSRRLVAPVPIVGDGGGVASSVTSTHSQPRRGLRQSERRPRRKQVTSDR